MVDRAVPMGFQMVVIMLLFDSYGILGGCLAVPMWLLQYSKGTPRAL